MGESRTIGYLSSLKIIFAAALTVFLLALTGCSGKDDGGAVTGNVVKDTQPVGGTAAGTPAPSVACSADTECGQEKSGEPYCFQGNAFAVKTIYKCINPGSVKSYCSAVKKDAMIGCDKVNGEVCVSGKCLPADSLPCKDSDGGKVPETQGVVIDYSGNELGDECIGTRVLQEAYCENAGKGRAVTASMTCDFLCRQGECITEYEKSHPNG